jgi:MATE family multidrug resistance protein
MKKHSYYKDILRLAYPISLGQLGNVLANMADSLMLGNYNADHLAASAFSFNIFITVLLFLMGFSIGITPLVAQSEGKGDTTQLAKIFKNGFITNVLFGGIALLILGMLYFLMPFMGQEEHVLELAQPYFVSLSFSMVPLIFYIYLKQYIEGFGLTRPAMYFSFVSNGLNVFMNYLLIEGHWGFDEMGITGAGYATLISRVLLPVMMVSYVFRKQILRKIILRALVVKVSLSECFKIVKLSFPISVQLTVEVFAFASAAISIGTIGADELAAHQIAIILAAVSYIIMTGVGSSATIIIGQYIGIDQLATIPILARSVARISLTFMGAMGFIYFFFRFNLPQLFLGETDVHIADIAANLLIITAIFQLPDGLQSVFLGVLRGMKDVWYPTLITIVAYWVVSIPLGRILAFSYGLGEIGIWLGLVGGLTLSATFLYFRMQYKLNWLIKDNGDSK